MGHRGQSRMLGPVAAGLLALAAPVTFAMPAPAQAEIPQVDGHLWMESTSEQKQAYLVGVINLLEVSQALREKHSTVEPNDPLARYLKAADVDSLDRIQQRLDDWYGADTLRLSIPVLGALWRTTVEAVG